jgi:hypothetical protein
MSVGELRRVARMVPGLLPVVRGVRSRVEVVMRYTESRRRVFPRIYEGNGWRGTASVSGAGSHDDQTRQIREQLPVLWGRYRIRRLVDAPCGDFRWMQTIVANLDEYTGIDIAKPLICRNLQAHASARVHFRNGDLVHDRLPAADMMLCRDCLVHLPFRDVHAALDNMKRSGSTYRLTTTFPDRERNRDIRTGSWRPLNLMRPPFEFPAPIEIINEGCTLDGGRFPDKSLALWRMADRP